MKSYEENETETVESPQRVSEFLFPALQSIAPGGRITKNVVVNAWTEVMGKHTTRHVKVVGLSNKKLRISTGELHWYRTIQKEKNSIISRLNTYLKHGVIETVEIVYSEQVK